MDRSAFCIYRGGMTRIIGCTSVVLLLVVAAFLTRGLDAPTSNPEGGFSFAVMGDAPYSLLEELRFRLVLQDLQAHDLTSVISIGDIFWRPCSDEMYRRSRARFDGLRHPVVYTPGDNEWFDCWERGSGSYSPQERLVRLREIFFNPPDRSLGGSRMPLTSQPEFVENVRWAGNGIVFATVHLIGSANGMRGFPARSAVDDLAVRRRNDAAVAWTRETFSGATSSNAAAVVIALHGNPFDDEPADREPFQPFLIALQQEAARFQRPVLVAHGDSHRFTVDQPLGIPKLTRLQVPGSPDVGWVRVRVLPRARSPFAFESHIIPRWKHW
jgi:hypothetical protein